MNRPVQAVNKFNRFIGKNQLVHKLDITLVSLGGAAISSGLNNESDEDYDTMVSLLHM